MEVAFDKPINDLESLQAIGGISEVRKEGDKFRLYTNKPGDVACRLAEYANAYELQVLALNTLGPSLDISWNICFWRECRQSVRFSD